MPKRRRNTRKGQNRSTAVVAIGTGRQLVPFGPATQSGKRVSPRRNGVMRRRNTNVRGLNMLSPAGIAFLKCATSPPDFQADPGRGIPDPYEGRVLPVKHASTFSQEFAAGKDTYLVFAPIPGVFMSSCVVDIGKEPRVFNSTFHQDATYKGFDKFRFASVCVGIYPTSNFNQFGGSITCFKVNMSIGETTNDTVVEQGTTTTNYKRAKRVGFRLNNADFGPVSPSQNYSAPFIDGVYTQSFQTSSTFEFTECQEFSELSNYTRIYTGTTAPEMTGSQKHFGFGNEYVAGIGNLETIVIKITTPTGCNNAAIIKAWQCLEVVPSPSTPLYKFINQSPPYDPLALTVYRKLAQQLPIAVTAKENAHSWDSVSGKILQILKVISYVPGPAGMVASGLGIALSGIRDLTI